MRSTMLDGRNIFLIAIGCYLLVILICTFHDLIRNWKIDKKELQIRENEIKMKLA